MSIRSNGRRICFFFGGFCWKGFAAHSGALRLKQTELERGFVLWTEEPTKTNGCKSPSLILNPLGMLRTSMCIHVSNFCHAGLGGIGGE